MDDQVNCEVCGRGGNLNNGFDLHHIWARSTHKELENELTNLILLCRQCHTRYGDKKKWYDFLTEKHKERIDEKM
jgi:5-methylcytosine-specific restriction endonuclease McrA